MFRALPLCEARAPTLRLPYSCPPRHREEVGELPAGGAGRPGRVVVVDHQSVPMADRLVAMRMAVWLRPLPAVVFVPMVIVVDMQ